MGNHLFDINKLFSRNNRHDINYVTLHFMQNSFVTGTAFYLSMC